MLALALDGGTYGVTQRHSLAVVVWWVLACGFAFQLWSLPNRRSGVAPAALSLTGLALLTAASMSWAADREAVFLEIDRVALYLGVFALAALAGRRSKAMWCDGLALGTAAVAAVALASRFFPSLLPSHDLPRFLPGTAERLSYPVDYWNGLAVLLAIGIPLLLRAALVAERTPFRDAATGALPGLAAAIFLTGSRTGVASVAIAATVFVALAEDRWEAVTTTLVASLGSAGAILVLLDRRALVDGPLDAPGVASQGHVAAALVLALCIATGLTGHAVRAVLPRLPRPGRKVAAGTTTLALLVAAALAIAAHPRQRVEAFAHAPTASALSRPDFVESHLLSTEGGGRWQFWRAAAAEFEHRPLTGGGAGSYEAWWAKHGSLPVFVRYAHSLYLEVLAELGVFGLLLLVAALGSALVVGIRAAVRASGAARTTLAALVAAVSAYVVAAGVDWMWQLTIVSVVAFACLGLLVAPHSGEERTRNRQRLRFVRPVGVAVALLVTALEALPLLTGLEVQQSQAAARRGDTVEARGHALTAARLEPWAASPYLQLALVDEQRQDLPSARDSIRRALELDTDDWRLWLVSARIETELGAIGPAKKSLLRAADLNPRSAIFGSQVRDVLARR